MLAMEMLNGKVAEQVPVEEAEVPASGLQATTVSAALFPVIRKLTTVPTGMLVAARLTATAPVAAMVTSGVRTWPEACAGTGTPFIELITRDGAPRVELAGGTYRAPTIAPPVAVPVKLLVFMLKRTMPLTQFREQAARPDCARW